MSSSDTIKKIPFERLTPRQREHLFEEMRGRGFELLGSRQGEPITRFRFNGFPSHSSEEIQVTTDGPMSNSAQNTFMLNFALESGVYFLSTSLKNDSGTISFDFSVPIFKIQRRKNFRCPLPQGISSLVEVKTKADGEKKSGTFRVRELGGRGASLVLPPTENQSDWTPGTKYFIDLNVANVSFKNLHIVVRHCESSPSAPWVGLEFLSLTMGQESEISSLVLEFQRIWFQLYAQLKD